MITCEVRGIPVEIRDDVLDDFRMLRLLRDLRAGDALAMVEFAERLFGSEQLENVMKSLDEDGVCRMTDVAAFINEVIMAAAAEKSGDVKN